MKVTQKKEIVITLEMNIEEAKWLFRQLNVDVSHKEPPKDENLRRKFLNALNFIDN